VYCRIEQLKHENKLSRRAPNKRTNEVDDFQELSEHQSQIVDDALKLDEMTDDEAEEDPTVGKLK